MAWLLPGGCPAFIAIALLMPNLESSPQRNRQKRTMADFRTIASELETYRREHRDYPAASTDGTLRRLSRAWLPAFPYEDPWGNKLRYERLPGGGYAISSAQKDGKFEQPSPSAYAEGVTRYFDCDIVFVDGSFVRSPENLPR